MGDAGFISSTVVLITVHGGGGGFRMACYGVLGLVLGV